jgi:hypothetical protein
MSGYSKDLNGKAVRLRHDPVTVMQEAGSSSESETSPDWLYRNPRAMEMA